MTTSYQIKDQQGIYFLTFRIIEWIGIFTRQAYQDIVINSLKYCVKNKDLRLFAYLIMSNHLHLIVQSLNGNLSNTIRDFKKYSSKKIVETMQEINESRKNRILNHFKFNAGLTSRNERYQVWNRENHAEELYSSDFMEVKVNYLHMNPVRAGIVYRPEDYIYSSARNYYGMDGTMIEIEKLDLKWHFIK